MSAQPPGGWNPHNPPSQGYGPAHGQPHPLYPPPPKKGVNGWMLAFLGLLALPLLCCGGFFALGLIGTASSSASSSSEAAAASRDIDESALIEVSASDLVNEYQDNELAADKKYKGQTLKVSGVIDEIDTEIFNENKYILVIAGASFTSLSCHDMGEGSLSQLAVGDDVTVIGKLDDGGDLGVDLKHCRLA